MSEFVEDDWKLKAHAVVKLRRENTNMLVSLSLSYVQYLKYTDKTNCAMCFVNYQLRRHEGTGLDDHAHGRPNAVGVRHLCLWW